MSKKYNIAIVGGSLSTFGGGAPRSMAQQATTLMKTGHHVELFVGHSRKYPLTKKEFSCKDVPINASPLWGPSVLGVFPGALYELWKRAREFDFIHLNGAWNLTTFLGALIARSRKIPYIITMRGHFGEYHFQRMPHMKKILFQLLEKNNIKHACAMHATAQWEVDTSAKSLKYAKQVIVIPNPVDLTDFMEPPSRTEARKELGLKDSDFHVVHLGRLAKQKNLPLLVETFAKANLGESAFLTFIGPPELDLKRAMVKQIERLGIAKNIHFIAFAKGQERCNWLAAADLFALPSFDENFCIVAIESVASGTHCLLSPNIGAVEFCPEKYATVIPLDLDSWTSALKEQFSSKKKQCVPAQSNFNSFSEKTIAKQWIQFYKEAKESPE
ncbi:MAG: glycosyltransferase [Pontiella sp.]